jgi:hypothetical protein
MRISLRAAAERRGRVRGLRAALFDKLGALVEPFTDRPEIWRGGRSLFWMRAIGRAFPCTILLAEIWVLRNGSSAPRPAAQRWRAACLGQHLPFAGDLPRVPDSKIEDPAWWLPGRRSRSGRSI